MRFRRLRRSPAVCAAHSARAPPAPPVQAPADTAYRNGFVYTVDAQDSVQQAVAIRAGRIVYVGSDRAWRRSSANTPRSSICADAC